MRLVHDRNPSSAAIEHHGVELTDGTKLVSIGGKFIQTNQARLDYSTKAASEGQAYRYAIHQ